MSPVFAARRRAEEFDSLVEGASTTVDEARYAELLELVGTLRSTQPVEARPEFVVGLRERLMTAAATELTAGSPNAVDSRLTVTKRSPRERRLAAAVGGFALVGATTSMAVAAQSALPGDALYPLKRAIENAHTGLSMDDADKGSTLLANAEGRLVEVDELVRQPSAQDVPAISETLLTFADQAEEASALIIRDYEQNSDEAVLLQLETFTAESFEALDELAAVLPDEAHDALVEAGNTLTEIDQTLQSICPTCDGAITSIPRWLLTSAEGVAGQLAAPKPAEPAVSTGKTTRPGKPRPSQAAPSAGTQPSGGATPAPQPGLPLQQPSQSPDGGQGGAGAGSGEGQDDPVGELIGGITGGAGTPGGGSTTGPGGSVNSGNPPVVGEVLEGVGDAVDGVTGPLKP